MTVFNVEESHKYDITSKLSPYLDPRMLIHIINWLTEKNIYSPDELNKLKSDILQRLDSRKLEQDKFKEVESELIQKITPFKDALTLYKKDQFNRMGSTAERISISSLTRVAQNSFESTSEFPPDVDELILKLAKLYFDHEDYANCKAWLAFYINKVSKYTTEGYSVKNRSKCYWGLISCNILTVLLQLDDKELLDMSKITAAPNDNEDKEAFIIEQNSPRSGVSCILKFAELLNSDELNKDRRGIVLKRAWLLHWSLFYIFKYHLALNQLNTKGTKSFEWPQLQEYLLDERNVAVVQLVAPHLLRYYAVYAILNRNRKDHFRTISNAILNAKSKYSDTFTSLLGALFIDFNFEAAQKHISEIKDACYVDVFLDRLKDAIEENSRHIIFETYCRIHKSINLNLIAQKVNMSSFEAEKWIVNIIRHSHLEAKIDSEKNTVEISTPPPNIYQQVIEKTQNLTLRSNMILQNLAQYNQNADYLIAQSRTLDNIQQRRQYNTQPLRQYSQQQKKQQRFTNFTSSKDRDLFRNTDQESIW